MSGNAIVIGAVVLIIVIYIALKAILRKGVDKAADSITNARKRSLDQKDPPKQESLADRYAGQNQNKTDQSSNK